MKWYEKQKKLFEQTDNSKSQQAEPGYEEPKVEPVYEPEVDYSQPNQQVVSETPQPNNSYVPDIPQEPVDTTVIAEKTILLGDIESDCDLFIYGHVKGNIECLNGNVTVCGEVEGKINCLNAICENAIVRDDITCGGNLKLDSSSAVNGNISAVEVYINGKIKGDIKAEDVIHLGSSSIVIGSISAADIEIERGSIIQGGLMIRQDYVEE